MAEPVIWKFELEYSFNMQLIELPWPGRIIAAGPDAQTGEPVIWAEVDPEPDARTINRIVQVCWTGHRAPLDARHINTFTDKQKLVHHIYEMNP